MIHKFQSKAEDLSPAEETKEQANRKTDKEEMAGLDWLLGR